MTIIALAFVSEARAQKYSFSTVYSFKSIGGSRRNSAVLRKISAQEIKRIEEDADSFEVGQLVEFRVADSHTVEAAVAGAPAVA